MKIWCLVARYSIGTSVAKRVVSSEKELPLLFAEKVREENCNDKKIVRFSIEEFKYNGVVIAEYTTH